MLFNISSLVLLNNNTYGNNKAIHQLHMQYVITWMVWIYMRVYIPNIRRDTKNILSPWDNDQYVER